MRAPLGGLRSGIMFNDITTLLLRPRVFKDAVDLFVERYRGMGIDAVAGKQQNPTDTSPSIVPPTSLCRVPTAECRVGSLAVTGAARRCRPGRARAAAGGAD
jgi:hypothetical protein